MFALVDSRPEGQTWQTLTENDKLTKNLQTSMMIFGDIVTTYFRTDSYQKLIKQFKEND
jgi:hypothetical protein